MIIIINKELKQMEHIAKRNTVQKSTIESVVLSSCDHPTADTIFERVKELLPKVSLGTVYRVLGDLVEGGKVRRIAVPGAPDRFDKTTHTHAHFHCEKCGRVVDIEGFADGFLNNLSSDGHLIHEAEIVFKGVCSCCNH